MEIVYKIPQETSEYKDHSDLVIAQISSIMKYSIESGRNRIFIHTNLKRGLPLENINKIAGPFVEAGRWSSLKISQMTQEISMSLSTSNLGDDWIHLT